MVGQYKIVAVIRKRLFQFGHIVGGGKIDGQNTGAFGGNSGICETNLAMGGDFRTV